MPKFLRGGISMSQERSKVTIIGLQAKKEKGQPIPIMMGTNPSHS
jgi:hypothetical protein